MKTTSTLLLWITLALLTGDPAEAAYSCSVTSSGIATDYDSAAAAARVVQSSATVTCTRASGDANTMDFTLSANNGQQPSGGTNMAIRGAQLIGYELYRRGDCSRQWRPTGVLQGPLNFGSSLSASLILDYWVCIPRRQTGRAAGTYTDLVTMTLTYGPGMVDTGTFPVSISTPWQCGISPTAGVLDFGAYLAFGPLRSASSTFGVTCTNSLPYTVTVNPPSGVISGLNYSVAPALASNTGTGMLQLLTINGSMPAGQAGTCGAGSCSGSNMHTVTLTY